MKKFFKTYLDLVLMISALVMAGLLVWLFLDTSAQIATYFSQAVSAGRGGVGTNTAFKVQQATTLNFRGLANPSPEALENKVTPEVNEVPTTSTSPVIR